MHGFCSRMPDVFALKNAEKQWNLKSLGSHSNLMNSCNSSIAIFAAVYLASYYSYIAKLLELVMLVKVMLSDYR